MFLSVGYKEGGLRLIKFVDEFGAEAYFSAKYVDIMRLSVCLILIVEERSRCMFLKDLEGLITILIFSRI